MQVLVSGGTVYWTNYGLSTLGALMAIPTAGGTAAPIASGLDDPAAIASSGNTIYWTNADSSANNGFITSLSPF